MPDVLVVQGTDIRNISKGTEQFICLTDIANRFGSSDLINDWLKNKNTLEFLGVWEKLNNDEFDEESVPKDERLRILNEQARRQMKSLLEKGQLERTF